MDHRRGWGRRIGNRGVPCGEPARRL